MRDTPTTRNFPNAVKGCLTMTQTEMNKTNRVDISKLLKRLEGGMYESDGIGYRETMKQAAMIIRILKTKAERYEHLRNHVQSTYIRCADNEKVPVLVFKPDFKKLENWKDDIDTAVDRNRGVL